MFLSRGIFSRGIHFYYNPDALTEKQLTDDGKCNTVFLLDTTILHWIDRERKMKESKITEYLMHFGLSRQEALIYEQLLSHGKQTGYEIARNTGISRSNAYTSLAALVEKGAAYLVEESARKYIPVLPEEFCGNRIRRMEKEKKWLVENISTEKHVNEGYITVEGTEHIRDKIDNLLENASERVYLSCSASCIREIKPELERLVRSGKKLVLITDQTCEIPGACIYVTESKGSQIGLIADSRYVLSGEYGAGSMNTCLYSGHHNFVILFKTALANEIELIKIRKGEKENG